MIRFFPWEPETADPRIGGVRLLVLGESHYEEADAGVVEGAGDFTGHTREIVERWGRRGEARKVFFANIYTLLTGEPWTVAGNHRALWDNLFFYNYVQTLVPGGARHRPTPKMFADSEPAFREVLEQIRPDAVLAVGEDGGFEMVECEALGGDWLNVLRTHRSLSRLRSARSTRERIAKAAA